MKHKKNFTNTTKLRSIKLHNLLLTFVLYYQWHKQHLCKLLTNFFEFLWNHSENLKLLGKEGKKKLKFTIYPQMVEIPLHSLFCAFNRIHTMYENYLGIQKKTRCSFFIHQISQYTNSVWTLFQLKITTWSTQMLDQHGNSVVTNSFLALGARFLQFLLTCPILW